MKQKLTRTSRGTFGFLVDSPDGEADDIFFSIELSEQQVGFRLALSHMMRFSVVGWFW